MISDELSHGESFGFPFSYYVASQALTVDASMSILDWLEKDAPWRLVEETFYEQYEFNFYHADLPAELSELVHHSCLHRVKNMVEGLFDVKLSDRINFSAHKLVPGQRIRVHNDYLPGQETHRLLIQLNRGWSDENGGFLMFFNSDNANDIHKIIRPLHNSCAAFAISPDSNHAVSTIHHGHRYTLVYSFYQVVPCLT